MTVTWATKTRPVWRRYRAIAPAVPLLLGLILLWSGQASGLEIPSLAAPVVDAAGILSRDVQVSLNQELRRLHQEQGPQVQVLTLSSLEGLTVEQASLLAVEKWNLGDAKRDDGVLILIAPKERKVRIEVGQGLEGLLPDVIASRIVREVMLPEFRSSNFDRGVILAVQYVVQAIVPQSDRLPFHDLAARRRLSRSQGWILAIWLIFAVIMLYARWWSRRYGRRFTSSRYGGGGFWGGTWSSGGGGLGGGTWSGGGWSGGGGGFSGGGASGGW